MNNEKKKEEIEIYFRMIMKTLGVEFDDSTEKTPYRVAKMFVDEIFYGMDPSNKPRIMIQENKFKYDQMLIVKDIKVNSMCEHHFVPMIGKAHIAYIPKEKILGLSKFNRIVDYFSRRPQVQERLTEQILTDLKKCLETDDIAVMIECEHLCVKLRGIKDQTSKTITSALSGKFFTHEVRTEFLNLCRN